MPNYSKNIKESNYENAFNYFITNGQSLMECYHSITNNLHSDNFDLEHLHNSFFIYQMMKNKTQLKDFKKVIEHMYSTVDSYKIGIVLSNYFYLKDCEISLSDYLKKNQKNDFYIGEHMHYAFMDIKDKKIVLNQERVPYLQTIISCIKDPSIIENSNLNSYSSYFLNSLESLGPMYEAMNNNSIFSEINQGEFYSSFDIILSSITSQIYSFSKKKLADIFHSLSKAMPEFEEYYLHSLTITKSANKRDFEGKMLIFAEYFGMDKIFDHYHTLCTNDIERDKKSISTLCQNFCSMSAIYLSKYDYLVKYEKIDIKQPIEKQFIYVAALVMNLKNNKQTDIPLEIANYLKKELYSSKKKSYDSISGIFSYFLETDNILPILNYISLDEKVVHHSKKTNKAHKL